MQTGEGDCTRLCLVLEMTAATELKAASRRHICVVGADRHSAVFCRDGIQGLGVLCAAAQLRLEDKWRLSYFTQNSAELAPNQHTGHMYGCFCAGRDEKSALSVPLGLVFPLLASPGAPTRAHQPDGTFAATSEKESNIFSLLIISHFAGI